MGSTSSASGSGSGSSAAGSSAAGSSAASHYTQLKILSGKSFTNVRFHEYKDWDIYLCTAYNSIAENTMLYILGAKHCAARIEVKHDDPLLDPKNSVFEFWLEAHQDVQTKQMVVSTSDQSPFKDQPLKVTEFYLQQSQYKKCTKVSKVLQHLESYIQKNPVYDLFSNNCFDVVAEVFIACNQPLCAKFVRDCKKKELINSPTGVNNLKRAFGLNQHYAHKQYVRQQIIRRRLDGWIIEDDGKIISAPPTKGGRQGSLKYAQK